MKRTDSEVKKLDSEIESAEEKLQEALARLQRLRRQREVARKKKDELFIRGMRELDEEDGIRSQEEAILAEQQAIGDAQSLGAPGLVDWTVFDFSAVADS